MVPVTILENVMKANTVCISNFVYNQMINDIQAREWLDIFWLTTTRTWGLYHVKVTTRSSRQFKELNSHIDRCKGQLEASGQRV